MRCSGILALAVLIVSTAMAARAAESIDGPIFGAWDTSCRIDAMTDRKTCIVLQIPLVAGTRGAGSERVIIGRDHY